LRSLDTKRSDSILIDALAGSLVERENASKYKMAFVSEISMKAGIKVGIGVAKNNDELLELMHKGLTWFVSSGRYDETMKKWGLSMDLKEPVAIVKTP
jgi:ABC-type amino acid transport substrate-binding protein